MQIVDKRIQILANHRQIARPYAQNKIMHDAIPVRSQSIICDILCAHLFKISLVAVWYPKLHIL